MAPPVLDMGYRPPEYTHPIERGPGRAEQRAVHNAWRAQVARAARLRDQWTHRQGKPTPAEPIRAAIRRISERGQDFRMETDGRRFQPIGPSRNRWKAWRGAMVPDEK